MIRHVRNSSVCLLACLVSLGCTEHPQGEIETLANGATLVRNPSSGVWSEEDRWTLIEDLRIGALDGAGPDVFGDAGRLSLAIHPDGRIYVLDGQAQEIRVFASSGEHIRTFGRGGAGPGELGWASLAGWGTDGNLWVADPANSRYSVFSADGEYITSHRREISFASYPWTGLLDREDRLLDVGIRPATQREQVLIRVEPITGVADTFALPRYEARTYDVVEGGVVRRSIQVPFAGQLVWRPDRNGHLWSTITDEYRIVQQTLSGDTLRIIERTASPERVPPELKEEALEYLREISSGVAVDPSRIPDTMPVINNFAVDDKEYLWVSVWNSGERSLLDIFDPIGRYLGRVESEVDLRFWPTPPIFQDENLYAFTTDELGIPSVVRIRVENRRP